MFYLKIGSKDSGMLIVAVTGTGQGNMIQVRPVRAGGNRERTQTTQSEPTETMKFSIENEVGTRARKTQSDGNLAGGENTGNSDVRFTVSPGLGSLLGSDSEYNTASDTENEYENVETEQISVYKQNESDTDQDNSEDSDLEIDEIKKTD